MLRAFSMWLIALNWTDKIRVIGLLGGVCGGVILGIWLLLSKIGAKGGDMPCLDGSRS